MAAGKDKTVEERVVVFAEQLGRLIGTVESKTEGWINQDQKAFRDQLTQLRDSAAELLSHLGGALSSGRDVFRPSPPRISAKRPRFPIVAACIRPTVWNSATRVRRA